MNSLEPEKITENHQTNPVPDEFLKPAGLDEEVKKELLKIIKGLISESDLHISNVDRLETEVKALINNDLEIEGLNYYLESDMYQDIKEGYITEERLPGVITHLENEIKRYKAKGQNLVVNELEEELVKLKLSNEKISRLNLMKLKRDILLGGKEGGILHKFQELNEELKDIATIDQDILEVKKHIEEFKGKKSGQNILDNLNQRLVKLENLKIKIEYSEKSLGQIADEIRKSYNLEKMDYQQFLDKIENDSKYYETHNMKDIPPVLANTLEKFYRNSFLFKVCPTSNKYLISTESFYTYFRFKTTSESWRFGTGTDAIDFKFTGGPLSLIGVGLYKPVTMGNTNIINFLKLCETDNKKNLIEINNLSITRDNQEKIFKCFFNLPLKLEENKKYTIVIQTTGTQPYKGDSQNSGKFLNANFEFSKSQMDKNGTDISSGQLPEFYFIEK